MQREIRQTQALSFSSSNIPLRTNYHHHSSSPLSINFRFSVLCIYIISRHIGNWILTKNENKKKVIAKVVDFPDFGI